MGNNNSNNPFERPVPEGRGPEMTPKEPSGSFPVHEFEPFFGEDDVYGTDGDNDAYDVPEDEDEDRYEPSNEDDEDIYSLTAYEDNTDSRAAVPEKPEKKKNPIALFFRFLGRLMLDLFVKPGPAAEGTTKASRRGIKAVAVVSLVILSLIALYYGYLMILKGEQYKKEAYDAQNKVFETAARRGNIYDANGNPLAITLDTYTVSVSRKDVSEYGEDKYEGTADEYRRLVANGIGERTDVDPEWIYEELKKEVGNYKDVAVGISSEKGENVKKWVSEEKIKGVTVTATCSRYYPNGSLAAHVIGFTGTDNYGLVCGMEVMFNDELAGTNGKILATVEKNGNAITGEPREVIQELKNGVNVNMTIDKNIQRIAEDVLLEAVRDFGVSEGGGILIMNPKNGDILTMASYPTFDLNDPMTVLQDIRKQSFFEGEESKFISEFVWKNRMIASSYEPGSTFKAITASIALEEGIVTPETTVSDLPLEIDKWTIHCSTANNENGHGEEETFRMAIANSCNPVMARVALTAGVDKFYKYVREFGFYNKTNVLLSGEEVGVMHKDPTEVDLAVTAFGQRFTITPIQLAAAYCAIANGGTLYEPRIVTSLTDEEGRTVKEYPPKQVRNVISKNTSATVLELLEGVVSKGTGVRAFVSGYKVAGKTGTAETVDTERTGRYVVSFSAIAPSDRPEIVVLVMLDHPDSTYGDVSGSRMGGWMAGTVIKRVLEYKQVKKIYTEEDLAMIRNVYYADDLTGMTCIEAMNWFKTSSRAYNVVVVGDPETHPLVTRMYPETGVYTARECTQVIYFTDDPDAKAPMVKVPDLTGLTLGEAHGKLTSLELNMDCRKGDVIISQDVPPGTLVEKGTVIILEAETAPEG
ncbi:MAG: PASTA domain-containing protein [Clostridia bacterium]|nr:PASTA domain-containing protein [Clostridia bacterium]